MALHTYSITKKVPRALVKGIVITGRHFSVQGGTWATLTIANWPNIAYMGEHPLRVLLIAMQQSHASDLHKTLSAFWANQSQVIAV